MTSVNESKLALLNATVAHKRAETLVLLAQARLLDAQTKHTLASIDPLLCRNAAGEKKQ